MGCIDYSQNDNEYRSCCDCLVSFWHGYGTSCSVDITDCVKSCTSYLAYRRCTCVLRQKILKGQKSINLGKILSGYRVSLAIYVLSPELKP